MTIKKKLRRRNPKRRNPLTKLRRFYLKRKTDVSGVSGTGIVAVGTCFPNGRVTMQWQTKIKSMVYYDNIQEVTEVHGHDGKTVLKWLD